MLVGPRLPACNRFRNVSGGCCANPRLPIGSNGDVEHLHFEKTQAEEIRTARGEDAPVTEVLRVLVILACEECPPHIPPAPCGRGDIRRGKLLHGGRHGDEVEMRMVHALPGATVLPEHGLLAICIAEERLEHILGFLELAIERRRKRCPAWEVVLRNEQDVASCDGKLVRNRIEVWCLEQYGRLRVPALAEHVCCIG